MKFNTESERKAHPKVRLIPLDVWIEYFGYDKELPDALINLMQATDEPTFLTQLDTFHCSSEDIIRIRDYLALVFSHHNLSLVGFQTIKAKLGMSDFSELVCAAIWGNLNNFACLMQHNKDLIQLNDFAVFSFAAAYGHRHLLQYLAEQMPDRLQEMIVAKNFAAFRWAAENGHFHILKYLAEQAPDKLEKMIAVNDFVAFGFAARMNHAVTVSYLLRFPSVFAHVERIDEYKERYTQPFIMAFTAELQRRSRSEYPHSVYSQEEAQLCFYILRHFIRTQPNPDVPAIQATLNFLLSIPAVIDTLHRPISGKGYQNELLHLAMGERKLPWMERLLGYPMVMAAEQARNNDLSHDEVRQGLYGQLPEDPLYYGKSPNLVRSGAVIVSEMGIFSASDIVVASVVTPCADNERQMLTSSACGRSASVE